MKTIITTICLLALSFSLQAQSLNGPWYGELNAGNSKLGIIFTFEEKDGETICTMDVPIQGVKGFWMEIVELTETTVELKADAISAAFKGKIIDGKKIDGTWTQYGMPFPLVMTPGTGAPINRPQEPKPPYEYITENIRFYNTKDSVSFGGTLTLPVGYNSEGQYPVVLMITGSGQENRDEEIYDHKPFLVLADYLARHGIASLRYDDRGVGESTGLPYECTTVDFAEDAAAGIAWLRDAQDKYHFSRIGALGHSEGGTIAFRLAAQGEIDFMVSLAGTGIKGDSLFVEQANVMNRAEGRPSNLTLSDVKAMLGSYLEMPWYQWIFDYDPSETIASVKIPVMAINGSKDLQVVAESNLGAIRKLVQDNHPKNLIKEYPDLNHLFQHCETGSGSEYFTIEETMSPEVLEDIAEWINQL